MQAEVDADQEVHEEEAAEHEAPAEKDHKQGPGGRSRGRGARCVGEARIQGLASVLNGMGFNRAR